MEGLMNKNINHKFPTPWPGMSNEMRALTTIPTSPNPVPLAPSSYQVWNSTNVPYFESHGVGPTGIETPLKPSHGKTKALSLRGHDKNSNKLSTPWPRKDAAVPGLVAPKIAAAAGTNGDKPVTIIETEALSDRGQVRSGPLGLKLDPTKLDPKRLKRLASNRASVEKNKSKQLKYISDMEGKVKTLEAEIASLSPQVATLRRNQEILLREQKKLNQELIYHTRCSMHKEAEIEENKAEVHRLRELQISQQQGNFHRLMPVWQDGFEQMGNLKPESDWHGADGFYMNLNQAEIEANKAELNRQRELHFSQQENFHGLMPVWQDGFEQMGNPNPNQIGTGQMGPYMNLNQDPIAVATVNMDKLCQPHTPSN